MIIDNFLIRRMYLHNFTFTCFTLFISYNYIYTETNPNLSKNVKSINTE